MKNIFVINGSASTQSSNQKLIEQIRQRTSDFFNLTVCKDLKTLPHFDPELSVQGSPDEIVGFRQNIEKADGVLICTPEYVFSIPSGLKNALEWCISTNVFAGKPLGMITASAQGEKGQEELKLIMTTVMSKFTDDTTLLIQGIKGKIDEQGNISDSKTLADLIQFIQAFKKLVEAQH